MARRTIDDIDSALDYERESRLDRDSHREPYRVALRRVATSPADQIDVLRNRFASAFTRELPTTGEGGES